MRVVFDSNVLVSALLLSPSIPATALLKAKSTSSTILVSTEVFRELIQVLMRPKFDRYVSKEIRESFLDEFKTLCINVDIHERVKLCRDPKDNKYLELALSGKADCIVTGDRDLLIHNPFRSIRIITPQEFLNDY